jgi:potassium transporter
VSAPSACASAGNRGLHDRAVPEALRRPSRMFGRNLDSWTIPTPDALLLAREKGVEMNPEDLTCFLGRETIIVTRREGMAICRDKLCVLMARNAVRATAFFRLPPERVVELGVQVEM